MRLLDNTWQTQDEEYAPEDRIAECVENAMGALNLDTYNHRYVIRVTVDRVDSAPAEPANEEGEQQ